ncbi:RNA polymerase sigma factor [Rhodobacteraceae bacterium MYP1-1]|uniref:RNA polymerase sigma factor n=1 Tax=Halocynthiibacter styelae TaxID=2761955 RepID=A0A8J7IRS2_9RHOB|nr:RNA polymerase sigma factor [Paenihalocynthiibacter styelae]
MMRSFNTQLEKALPDIWRHACSLTHDKDAADDLVQDCIERALRKRLLWMPGRPLKPWLTKIMLNLYRDRWRYRPYAGPDPQCAAAGHISAVSASCSFDCDLWSGHWSWLSSATGWGR